MADESLSEAIGRHNLALQFDHISPEVIETAKLHILDSLGCLLAGTRLEAGSLPMNRRLRRPMLIPARDRRSSECRGVYHTLR